MVARGIRLDSFRDCSVVEVVISRFANPMADSSAGGCHIPYHTTNCLLIALDVLHPWTNNQGSFR